MRRRQFLTLLGGAATALPSYAALAQQQIPLVGFLNSASPETYRREQIVSFAQRHKLPVVGFVRQFAAVGALVSYGPSISWMYRQAGEYVGQILKGSNPAEMPVLQPTEFEFVINLKTATDFGLAISPTVLARADEVIE
jgi:putative ABC transport system substrate-binding protein